MTDDAIRRSLLGRADAVEQAKFEALLMLDDAFERRVHRLELELADDFSFGRLSSEEQQLFTTRFLVTPRSSARVGCIGSSAQSYFQQIDQSHKSSRATMEPEFSKLLRFRSSLRQRRAGRSRLAYIWGAVLALTESPAGASTCDQQATTCCESREAVCASRCFAGSKRQFGK